MYPSTALRAVLTALGLACSSLAQTLPQAIISLPVQLQTGHATANLEMNVRRGQNVRSTAAAFAEQHGLGSSGEDTLAATAFELTALPPGNVIHYRTLLLLPHSLAHLAELSSSWAVTPRQGQHYDVAIAHCPFSAPPNTLAQCLPLDPQMFTLVDIIESALEFSRSRWCAEQYTFGHVNDPSTCRRGPQSMLLAIAMAGRVTMSDEDLYSSFLRAAAAATGRHMGAERASNTSAPPFVLAVGDGAALVFDASPQLSNEGAYGGDWHALWPSAASISVGHLSVSSKQNKEAADILAAKWLLQLTDLGIAWQDKALSRRLLGPPPPLPTVCASTPSGGSKSVVFLVLIATQGTDDTSTEGTFADIASTISLGLQQLGYEVLNPLACAPTHPGACGDLQWAPFTATGRQPLQIIVLAPHNLARIVDSESGYPVLVAAPGHLPDQRGINLRDYLGNAVLYNFEHISDERGSHSSHATAEVLELYRSFGNRLWDFSAANVAALAKKGIVSVHVPLGFVAKKTESSEEGAEEVEKGTSILFYGTKTPHRLAVLHELRAAGLQVVHANAMNRGVFGTDLEELIRDSKIVLSLLAFDEEDEWKISRLAPLLAAARFVVAEVASTSNQDESFAATEQAALNGGVAFVTRSELARALKYYSARPSERVRIAAQGQALFSKRDEATILKDAVSRLIKHDDSNL